MSGSTFKMLGKLVALSNKTLIEPDSKTIELNDDFNAPRLIPSTKKSISLQNAVIDSLGLSFSKNNTPMD